MGTYIHTIVCLLTTPTASVSLFYGEAKPLAGQAFEQYTVPLT